MTSARVCHVHQRDFAIGKVLPGLAGIVAVVTFAGQDQNQIPGPCNLFGARSDNVPDAADDLSRRALRCPGGLLPFPHLGDADDWNWHRFIGDDDNKSQAQTKAENQSEQ